MPQIIFIIAIAIGIAVVVLLLARKVRQAIKAGALDVAGICALALSRTARKKKNKDNIMAFLAKRGEAGNNDIREALRFSRRSVARYMTELEQEGKVLQVGDIGRGVIYRLKPNPAK